MEKQPSIPELSVQSITTELLMKNLDADSYDEDQVCFEPCIIDDLRSISISTRSSLKL